MLTLSSQISFGFTIRGAVIAQSEEILEIRFRFRVELGNNGSVKSQCLKNKDIFQNFATSETLKNIWGYNFSKINQHLFLPGAVQARICKSSLFKSWFIFFKKFGWTYQNSWLFRTLNSVIEPVKKKQNILGYI